MFSSVIDVSKGSWLRENVRTRKARRNVFSIVLSQRPSPALLFFKLIEVETKFPFANSISAFSRSQDPKLSSKRSLETERVLNHIDMP